MPPQKGEVEDACVQGQFVPFHGKPKLGTSSRVGWVVAESGCHIWQGSLDGFGYGMVWVERRTRRVHRLRYEREVGPVPDGMILDHFVCDNPQCCNPEHVRPVTHRENVLRGTAPTALNAAKTHCPQGHPYSGTHLYLLRDGRRECRTCRNARARIERAQKKEKPDV